MSLYLKRGVTAGLRADRHRQMRDTAESILADIERRREPAGRELSVNFGRGDNEIYRLTPAEIQACIELTRQDLTLNPRRRQRKILRSAANLSALRTDQRGLEPS